MGTSIMLPGMGMDTGTSGQRPGDITTTGGTDTTTTASTSNTRSIGSTGTAISRWQE